MSFFKSIEQHLEGMNLNVVISKNENGLTVSVLPQPTCKDEAMKKLTPILLKGTSEELDAQFAGIIQQPLQRVSGISTNLVQFEKDVEKAAEKNAITKAEKEKTKKLTDKADKFLKEAAEMIKAKDIPGAVLKIKGALKIAPDYKKAKDLLKKHDKSSADMFEEKAVEVVKPIKKVPKVVVETETKVVEQVKEEIAEVVMASEPTAIAEKPLVDLSHIPNTLAEKTPVILGAESKEEVGQVQNALTETGLAASTPIKEVAIEEKQKETFTESGVNTTPLVGEDKQLSEAMKVEHLQENPIPIKEAFVASVEKVVAPVVAVEVAPVVTPPAPIVANEAKGQPRPKRLDMESMQNYEARLAAWTVNNPPAEVPAATIPSSVPIEEIKSPMQEMAEQDMVKREAEFEAEKVVPAPVAEVKAETPPAPASSHIEILG